MSSRNNRQATLAYAERPLGVGGTVDFIHELPQKDAPSEVHVSAAGNGCLVTCVGPESDVMIVNEALDASGVTAL